MKDSILSVYKNVNSLLPLVLHIITPCAGSRSLYSTLLLPVRGRGVCPLVNGGDFVGAQERIKVGWPSCHHH